MVKEVKRLITYDGNSRMILVSKKNRPITALRNEKKCRHRNERYILPMNQTRSVGVRLA